MQRAENQGVSSCEWNVYGGIAMTPEEAIKIAIHCLGVQAEREVCEECPVYLESRIACRDVARVAISALKEILQYRETGTVEECREAVDKQTPKKCVEDSCPDHTHYKCPSCGKIQKTKYCASS